MALTIKPTLYPLTKFAEVLHFTTTDASGATVPYTNTGAPPQVFFATSYAYNATAAHASLNCTMSHLGSGDWLATIASATLTFSLLNGLFTPVVTPPVLIAIVPNSSRDFAVGEYAPYRESFGSGVPTLYPDCKFDMPIHFTTINSSGVEVDYTDVMGTPVCYFSASRAHDAAVGLSCTMTYLGGSLGPGYWGASIASSGITYSALNTLAPLPATPLYLIQSVPSSSRDYAVAAWKEQREMLAA